MLKEFKKDLEAAKDAELLVLEVLADLTTLYNFQWVGDQRQYRYKGDIKATTADGKEIFIEVKDDKCIAATGNVLCEEENFIKDTGRFIKGNMYSDTDIFCVVSKSERKIYIIDFKILQGIYKKGEFKLIPHADQDTYCYLLPLWLIRRFNGIIKVLEY